LTLCGLNPTKNKVAFLKVPGVHFVAMVAAQSLLLPCSMDNSPEMILIKEHGIILPQLILILLIEG
jgi:hypothetical protein